MFPLVADPMSEAVAASQEAVFRHRCARLSVASHTLVTLGRREDCRRLDGGGAVARPSLVDYQKAKAQYLRRCHSVGSVLEVEGSADDAPPVLFLLFALSASGGDVPATDGQVKATTLGCHIT